MAIKETLMAALLFSTLTACSAIARERESTVCGIFKEPFLFWLWSSSAPDSDKSRVNSFNHVKNIEFITSDKKKLNGYVYLAHNNLKGEVPAKGYILVALGNAMI